MLENSRKRSIHYDYILNDIKYEHDFSFEGAFYSQLTYQLCIRIFKY